jgi:hypothetical protein
MGRPHIDSIRLRTAGKFDQLPVEYQDDDKGGKLVLKPGSAYRYQLEIKYEQALMARSATYLITTAKAWGQPLEHGWFQVIADSSLGELQFEMPFKKMEEAYGQRRYFYEARPFSPDRDLVVRW